MNESAHALTVAVRCPGGPDETWPALRDPVLLSRWFGDLTPDWLPGTDGRIDFGDGDFFDVTVEEVVERRHITFVWRFLGLGSAANVRWSITGHPGGSVVTVEDRQPDRTPAEAAATTAGWTDFLDRLARYLRTGRPSRYGQRDEIDGAVTLPGGFDPLHPGVVHRWLPIATDGFEPRWFFVVDEDGPRRFRLDGWRHEAGEVRFRLQIPEAARHTECVVRLDPLTTGARLSFVHAGWCRLGLPEYQARLLRRRFTATWVASLAQAGQLAAPR